MNNSKCFFCGNICGDSYSTKNYVKKTFTNRDIVKSPSSEFVCEFCVDSLNEQTTINLCDGEVRKKQRMRTYSWIISQDKKTAFTKKHLKELRESILNPPEPPFRIILADSGQKHLLFRSKINLSRDKFIVSLEESYVEVEPRIFKEYLDICVPVIAACGKILAKDFEYNILQMSILIEKLYSEKSEKIITDFLGCDNKQLLKLALWLSPNKEESHELFRTRGI